MQEAIKNFVELPPLHRSMIMSPISDSTLYSFSFVRLIMHRFELLLKDAFASRTQNIIHTLNPRETFILVVKRKLKQKVVNVTVRY
jgi:endoribonuclease Dicer